jgi:ribonuclease HII
MCTRDEEEKLTAQGFKYIVGIDECGCGTLAGPVTICACYVPLHVKIQGINDSKKLTPKKRDALYDLILKTPDIKYSIVHIGSDIVDEINILQARFEGFYRAYQNLKKQVPDIDMVLIDGNQSPPQFGNEVKVNTIVGGDASCYCIGVASILAKVTRDRLMVEYDKQYPGYGLANHKGYHTPQHVKSIQDLGATPIHRKTFKGVC